MTYLIAGLGGFLTLVTYLWRRSVKQSDELIEDLTAHLEEERKQMRAALERKNKYIAELEKTILATANPTSVLNGLFRSSSGN